MTTEGVRYGLTTVRRWFRMNRRPVSEGRRDWDPPLDCLLVALSRLADIDQRLRDLATEEFSRAFVMNLIGHAHIGHDAEARKRQSELREALCERQGLEVERDLVLNGAAEDWLIIARVLPNRRRTHRTDFTGTYQKENHADSERADESV